MLAAKPAPGVLYPRVGGIDRDRLRMGSTCSTPQDVDVSPGSHPYTCFWTTEAGEDHTLNINRAQGAPDIASSEIKPGDQDESDGVMWFRVNFVYIGAQPMSGVAVADYGFDESEDPYTYNIVIGDGDKRRFTEPHELGHLLTNQGHHSERWNLMYAPTSASDSGTATKRLTPDQEGLIRADPHTQ